MNLSIKLKKSEPFLDADYEWFYNTSEQKIYLKLPEKQNPNELNITIPVSSGLIQLKGKDNFPLKNIAIRKSKIKSV